VAGAADRGLAGLAQGGAVTRTSRRRAAVCGLSLLALAALIVPDAQGGQVRVNVGAGGNLFSPYAVNINQGDHVVWVWVAGSHTATNWTLPADSANISIDGSIFDSDAGGSHFGQGPTTRYTWKSDRTGHIPYVCAPHNPEMSGRVIISPLAVPPTINVADFRLTEVQFNAASGLDFIEISNLGEAAGDLRSYRLAVSGTGTGVSIVGSDFAVPAGGRVVIHTNQTGTTNVPPGHIYVPALGDLSAVSGSVALYVPSTLSFQNALTNQDLMLDFVQWGAGGQPNEATANQANFWTVGTSINGVADGHSIEYCQNATLDHGVGRWAEISPPNPGGNSDCLTPTLRDSWGHLKIIYR
jgi:plastocyanin